MDACMHDYAKIRRRHGEVKSKMLELRVNTPFGKDYGFICTCITGSTKFPKSLTTSGYCRITGLLPVQQRP